jgi:hypothetical protein
MMQFFNPGRIRAALQRILSLFRKKPAAPDASAPEDPYAYVPVPRKPRPSGRSAAAVMELPEE